MDEPLSDSSITEIVSGVPGSPFVLINLQKSTHVRLVLKKKKTRRNNNNCKHFLWQYCTNCKIDKCYENETVISNIVGEKPSKFFIGLKTTKSTLKNAGYLKKMTMKRQNKH